MRTMRVLVADDHSLFRRGVVETLEAEPGFTVVGEASDGREVVAKAEALRPDLIVMDLYMPHGTGLEATRAITATLPDVKIVFLTVSEEEQDLFEAVKAGAHGYLLKSVEPERLCDTLRGVGRGEAHITPALAVKILEELSRRSRDEARAAPGATLSVREWDVLRLLTQGAVNKEIAAALDISTNTVKNHLRHIMRKLHLENRVQVVSYALREGLVRERPEP